MGDEPCAELATATTSCNGTDCQSACCDGQTCTSKLREDCNGANEVFLWPQTLCTSSPCATGACCDASGVCTQAADQTACGTGIFLGNGTQCDTAGTICLGACCEGSLCSLTLAPDCPGVHQGAGTSCFPNLCPATPGKRKETRAL